MPLKDLKVNFQKIWRYQQSSPIFQTNSKYNVAYYIISKSTLFVWWKLIKVNWYLLKSILFNILDNVGRILTSTYSSLLSIFPFSMKSSAKIFMFSWIIVIGIIGLWEPLFIFNLLISFIILSLSTSWKVNVGFFLFFFYRNYTRVLFIFQNCLKNWIFIIFKNGSYSFFLYSRRNHSVPSMF